MKLHELKIEQKYFLEVILGRKTAEVRKNDRDFQVGDILRLREIIERKTLKDEIKYTGHYMLAKITHILTAEEFSGLADGYVTLSFIPLIEAGNNIHDGSYYNREEDCLHTDLSMSK